MSSLSPLRNQRGAALMVVLVMVVVLGLALGMTGTSWTTTVQREKEAELLWRGDQIRKGIESYVKARQPAQGQPGTSGAPPQPTIGAVQPGGGGAQGTGNYPRKLEDLIKDPGKTGTVRHLRKLYKDPMTGEDFVLIQAPGGGIKGVKSASKLEPFKKDGFSEVYEPFKDAERYEKWEFVYEPGNKQSSNSTGQGTVGGATGQFAPKPL